MSATPTNESWEERFVSGVLQRCQRDKGVAARLRRADNPATEFHAWEVLAALGVDLEREWQRLPFATVAAAIAKAEPDGNGNLPFGRAIAASFEDGRENDQAKTRLRRLLASNSIAEVCRLLRPLLSLIASRTSQQSLDYVRLLKQLRRFQFAAQDVKAQWAQEFYGAPEPAAYAKERS